MEALINWFLARERVKKVVYTRLFKEATDDVKEEFAGDVDKEATIKAEKLVNDLLSPVDLRNVVKMDKTHGFILIGDEKVDEGRLANLKAEAAFLLESDIWKIIYETPKELAQRQMFVASESLDDLKKGKSILYTLSTQKNIVDLFNEIKAKK